jgi:hypothetical protein
LPWKPVFPVHGRLTYQNKPMGQARIAFLPFGEGIRGTTAQATADDDGRYQLTTYRRGDGAPAGQYTVTVYWPAPRPSSAKLDPTDDTPAPDRLRDAYDVTRSKLKATVQERDNEIDFKLP